MIGNLKPQKHQNTDGTGQRNRLMKDLLPDHVQIEDRGIEALITAAQRLSKVLRFVDGVNPETTWEPFLLDNIQEYSKGTETEKALLRSRWARDLAAFLENPEQFDHDPEKRSRLARPHVALFLTFLRLLDQIKQPMNELVSRHLNFYYRERLGLKPKGPVPDQVHVIVGLAPGATQMKLDKGTALLAGSDQEGNERVYTTNKEVVISHAQVRELKTVFVDKRTVTIQQAHREHYPQDPGIAFVKMMELALGHPNPGDALPDHSTIGNLHEPDGFTALNNLMLNADVDTLDYIANHLYLSVDTFKFIMQTWRTDMETSQAFNENAWQEVYLQLERAYQNKVKNTRQLALKETHQEVDDLSTIQLNTDALLKEVYGHPAPGDDLPPYQGKAATIVSIYGDFNSDDVAKRSTALDYISNELFLSEKNFRNLYQLITDEASTPDDDRWEKAYRFLEVASRNVRQTPLPSPSLDVLVNVYAQPDAQATAFSLYGAAEESPRFRTFGDASPDANTPLPPAAMGWAISSPILALREGDRTITLTIGLTSDDLAPATLQQLFDTDTQEFPPFQTHLTTAEGWTNPSNADYHYGNFTTGKPEETLSGTLNGSTLEISITEPLLLYKGKYLMGPDATIYQIREVTETATQSGGQTKVELSLEALGSLAIPVDIEENSFLLYAVESVYLHSLQLTVTLGISDTAIGAITSGEGAPYFLPELPTLLLTVHHYLQGDQYISHYQHLMGLQVEKTYVDVNVTGLKDITLQNDTAILDGKKPFLPFDNYPEIGSSCYLTHPEIAQKRLDRLQLKLEWMNAPEDLKTHYENYWKIESDDLEPEQDEYLIQSNDNFRAAVHFIDGRATFALGDVPLFAQPETIPEVPLDHLEDYLPRPENTAEGAVLEQDRYLQLSLSGVDFQHGRYQNLFVRQAHSENDEIKKLVINPPYTPKLKGLSLNYSAHTELVPGTENEPNGYGTLYHLHPFGHQPLRANARPHLLPLYDQQGALYLGIENLSRPQLLSLLFQMAEGSADPAVEKPDIRWDLLAGDTWVPLRTLVSDRTNGLLNSGIIELTLPEAPNGGHTAFPSSLDWIRCTCPENIHGLPDTIAILAQALTATLHHEDMAPSHFDSPLPAGTISKTVHPLPGVLEVSQPFTSFNGRAPEGDEQLYVRSSERIRHKGRALTSWDYERMLLERFPELYKVKCLPGNLDGDLNQLGAVSVVIVPDIREKLPFNPFEPKVPANVLQKVKQYLENRAPAYASIQVVNPRYLQVKSRFSVRFHPGYDENFYRAQLENDLKRFLAPWAYRDASELTLGGAIYGHTIVNFIAEQPYVDFVVRMKLFQSEDGIHFTDVSTLYGSHIQVKAYQPDMILVSAQSHDISMISDTGYEDEDFEGINHMIVGIDFKVAD